MLSHSPSLAISTLALVFALGSGAGYAASTATDAGRPVFHHLRLGKGWRGDLEYAYANGIVYLDGLGNGNARKTGVMATLPISLIPKSQIEIPITFVGGGDGYIVVNSLGRIIPFGPKGAHYGYVSLDGVSFAPGAP
jgi:hypothetical protein